MTLVTQNDFNGVELKIGDTVAFIAPYTRALDFGKVVWFTPKMTEIEYAVTGPSWNTGKLGTIEKIRREPKYVTKISTPEQKIANDQ